MTTRSIWVAGILMVSGAQADTVPLADYRLQFDITALSASFASVTLDLDGQSVATGPLTITLDASAARGTSHDTIDFHNGSETVVAHLVLDAPLFASLGWGPQKLLLTETRAAGTVLASPAQLETGVRNEITLLFTTPLTGVGVFEAGQALSGWHYTNWLGTGTDKVPVKPPPPPPTPPSPPRPSDIFIDLEGTVQKLGTIGDAQLVSPSGQVYALGTADVSVTLASPVPEVSTWLLALAGLGVLALRLPRR